MHKVALVDLPDTDAPGERRPYRRITELGPSIFDLGAVALDLRTVLVDQGTLLIQLLPACIVLLNQVFVAFQVKQCASELCRVFGAGRLGLAQLRGKRTGVD